MRVYSTLSFFRSGTSWRDFCRSSLGFHVACQPSLFIPLCETSPERCKNTSSHTASLQRLKLCTHTHNQRKLQLPCSTSYVPKCHSLSRAGLAGDGPGPSTDPVIGGKQDRGVPRRVDAVLRPSRLSPAVPGRSLAADSSGNAPSFPRRLFAKRVRILTGSGERDGRGESRWKRLNISAWQAVRRACKIEVNEIPGWNKRDNDRKSTPLGRVSLSLVWRRGRG